MCRREPTQKDVLKLWERWLLKAPVDRYKRFTEELSRSLEDWQTADGVGLAARLVLRTAGLELDASMLEVPGAPESDQRRARAREVRRVLERVGYLKDIVVINFVLKNADVVFPSHRVLKVLKVLRAGYSGDDLLDQLDELEAILQDPDRSGEGPEILEELAKEMANDLE